MKRPDRFPELEMVEEMIRSGLSDVYPLAPRQIEDVYRPLPPGTDYLPSSLFLLACRSMGIVSEGSTIFASALRSFDLAMRALIFLVIGKGVEISPRNDHEHEEGMTLLVSDGLNLLAHEFLARLHSTEYHQLIPILVTRPREWIGQIESMRNETEGFEMVQRSMFGVAIQAIKKLVPDGNDSIDWFDRVTSETDRLLSVYRKSGGREERLSVVADFDVLKDTVLEIGEGARPLAHYISLVADPLSVTSSP